MGLGLGLGTGGRGAAAGAPPAGRAVGLVPPRARLGAAGAAKELTPAASGESEGSRKECDSCYSVYTRVISDWMTDMFPGSSSGIIPYKRHEDAF